MGVLAWAGILVPRQLEARKQRQGARLVAGAEALAIAIGRADPASDYGMRLAANHAAHVAALTQLGLPVPPLPVADAPPLAQAA